MSLHLSLHTQPEVPLEADCICPDKIQPLKSNEIPAMTVFHGNRQVELGEFFDCKGNFDGEITIDGDLANVKHLGASMSFGKIIVNGDTGLHTGAGMRGGEIIIEGNTADWLGAEMLNGKIIVKGDAGHMTGSGYRGSTIGMQGGEIIVHGNVKNETGHVMRRGLIAVGGNSGDFTGVNMLAGTIIVLGKMGIRTGAGMKRGSIISFSEADLLPTFSRNCEYSPAFIKFYLGYLEKNGFLFDSSHLNSTFERWSGDSIEINRGEILLSKHKNK